MTFQSKPGFIDSRFDIFEHEGVLADYLKAMYLVSSFEVLDKHRIDHVLLNRHHALDLPAEALAGLDDRQAGKDRDRAVCDVCSHPWSTSRGCCAGCGGRRTNVKDENDK